MKSCLTSNSQYFATQYRKTTINGGFFPREKLFLTFINVLPTGAAAPAVGHGQASWKRGAGAEPGRAGSTDSVPGGAAWLPARCAGLGWVGGLTHGDVECGRPQLLLEETSGVSGGLSGDPGVSSGGPAHPGTRARTDPAHWHKPRPFLPVPFRDSAHPQHNPVFSPAHQQHYPRC